MRLESARGKRAVRAFAPGRTEIAGNHTDHQGGRAVAATISEGVSITLLSEKSTQAHLDCGVFGHVEIDTGELTPRKAERNSTAALLRGVVSGLVDRGIAVSGFSGSVTSMLPAGGGLSSSAAFELALARGLELLFGNEDHESITPLELAKIGQHAESAFFGKPCGLLDQAAIACGGINVFDFHNAELPHATRIDFNFANCGYVPVLVDVGCDHSRHTAEYAQVADDMFAAAKLLGANRLSDVNEEDTLLSIKKVQHRLGDLVALRTLHFFNEARLVDQRITALHSNDIESFLALTQRSGISSAQYLQNVSCGGTNDQPAMVALAFADGILNGSGAVRIHGGGFGGSIQAFVPAEKLDEFATKMEAALFNDCCHVLHISTKGAQAEWI